VSKQTSETADAVAREADGSRVGPAVLTSLGSVALALYYYYVRGDKQRGQFVGLWPATILGLAAYLKLSEITRLLRESN